MSRASEEERWKRKRLQEEARAAQAAYLASLSASERLMYSIEISTKSLDSKVQDISDLLSRINDSIDQQNTLLEKILESSTSDREAQRFSNPLRSAFRRIYPALLIPLIGIVCALLFAFF